MNVFGLIQPRQRWVPLRPSRQQVWANLAEVGTRIDKSTHLPRTSLHGLRRGLSTARSIDPHVRLPLRLVASRVSTEEGLSVPTITPEHTYPVGGQFRAQGNRATKDNGLSDRPRWSPAQLAEAA
ncbi:unnamed protein product [Protopolystoma xenopodis]|uniref:Uncharacterized protein n=1 Tax=Protopolystoma xenopodis TaxID=117903 RepID=A0A3S5C8E8_9PLAT|nr:unnamed protein product [Protopolystoma xenopodis]